jgi:hypothetical protein
MITSSTRQGIFILFIFLILFLGILRLNMTYFQAFIIIVLSGIILKLTDIEEALK